MNMRKLRSKTTQSYDGINLEDHIDFWEEAKANRNHYFLNEMDSDLSQINSWMIHNSKYQYEAKSIQAVRNLYVDMCNELLSVRHSLTYEQIGKIINFLITDNRFYVKPFDFPPAIRKTYETFVILIMRWDEMAITTFPFAYKSIIATRYEVKTFLFYFALETLAQKFVAPKVNFSHENVLISFMRSLELPMSLYLDSFFMRKLLFKMGQIGAPAFSLQCTHPVLTQIHYIFMNHLAAVQQAWNHNKELKILSPQCPGVSYLIQAFLLDHHLVMTHWHMADYHSQVSKLLKPNIVTMIDTGLPVSIVDRILVQAFYKVVEDDVESSFCQHLLAFTNSNVNRWYELTDLWNDKMLLPQFKVGLCKQYKGTVGDSSSMSGHATNVVSLLFCLGMDGDEQRIVQARRSLYFILDHVGSIPREEAHIEVLLKYISIFPWNFEGSFDVQIQQWFEDVLSHERKLGIEDATTEKSSSAYSQINSFDNDQPIREKIFTDFG